MANSTHNITSRVWYLVGMVVIKINLLYLNWCIASDSTLANHVKKTGPNLSTQLSRIGNRIRDQHNWPFEGTVPLSVNVHQSLEILIIWRIWRLNAFDGVCIEKWASQNEHISTHRIGHQSFCWYLWGSAQQEFRNLDAHQIQPCS